MKRPHKQLDVWKLSMDLAVGIYADTASLPTAEKFGLVAQMRRCAVSIPSNIAEGAARRSLKEYRRFISIARGSLSELDTQLDLCLHLDYLSLSRRDAIDALLVRIDKMLHFLMLSKTERQTSG